MLKSEFLLFQGVYEEQPGEGRGNAYILSEKHKS